MKEEDDKVDGVLCKAMDGVVVDESEKWFKFIECATYRHFLWYPPSLGQ